MANPSANAFSRVLGVTAFAAVTLLGGLATGCASDPVVEATGTDQAAVDGSFCGAGVDEPKIDGTCTYIPSKIDSENGSGFDGITFTGAVDGRALLLKCEAAFPLHARQFCISDFKAFVPGETAMKVCGDKEFKDSCPRSIAAFLASTTLRYEFAVLKGWDAVNPPRTRPEQAAFLAEECRQRFFADAGKAACASLPKAVALAVGKSADMPDRVAQATCCFPEGVPDPPKPMPAPVLAPAPAPRR